MRISYLFIIALIIISCRSEQQKQQAAIARMEKSLEKELTADKAEGLLNLYEAYRVAHPEDDAQNATYLYKEAELRSKLGQAEKAADMLLAGLKDYRETAQAQNLALLLASLYEEKLEAYPPARTIYQIGVELFPENDTFKKKLSSNWKPFEKRMQELRKQVFNESTGRVDVGAAQDFILSAEVYAVLLPKDVQTPQLLFQAGDVAGATRDYEQSLALFERINEEYPDFEKGSQVLFMRAFTLDAELRRFEEAKLLYEAFLDKYPNDELAESAKFSLANLGKSEEEIIQGFMKKQEEQ